MYISIERHVVRVYIRGMYLFPQLNQQPTPFSVSRGIHKLNCSIGRCIWRVCLCVCMRIHIRCKHIHTHAYIYIVDLRTRPAKQIIRHSWVAGSHSRKYTDQYATGIGEKKKLKARGDRNNKVLFYI